ncbi:uncharacterized protein DUF4173 [Lachnotalea glycerini]|uniref:Uncharacterized protein DUF4173 n=1 Tax=Lachnotalea glycerini TaxID=1763509 RepID=A0A318ER78_9FIRM|nr:DUF4173 domain-containing protein [Lachnotalea glycerini]PXV93466.1 uncharacterized protein DUF4173 [Lachnotalea glycerini]
MDKTINQTDSETDKLLITNCEVETNERKTIQENFEFFGLTCILYAIFYTFCMYKNDAGITVPLLQAGTIFFFSLVIKKLGKKMKKDRSFYIISIMLLGISICLTDDFRLNVLSKLGIAVLFMSFMLHHFYDDSKWSLGKYLEALITLCISMLLSVEYSFVDVVVSIKSKQKKGNTQIRYILIGIGIAVPLTLIIMILLLSADRIFAAIIANLFHNLFAFKSVIYIILMITFTYIVVYCFINALAKRRINEEITDKRVQEPMIAITFAGIISVIYLLFCGIQIMGLFFDQLKLPENYTYAQYAREGFFQLLFVCGINLIMVLCCMAFFRESKLLKGILTVISVCTYIMTASSAYRMIIYISVYQLTFLRILVLWSLFVIALIMFGILISIYREKFPLFKYGMIVVTICYIELAYSHPDYIIASYNMNTIVIKAQEERQQINYENYGDLFYFTTLSADAAPVLAKYQSNQQVKEYFSNLKNDLENLNVRTYNVSRFIAKKVAADLNKQ